MQDSSSVLFYDPLSKENMTMDYRNSNYKQIVFQFKAEDKSIKVNQDFKVGKGGIFWDGSYVLCEYLFSTLKTPKRLKILELGAGTALPSLLAMHYGHSVCITDLKKNLDLIKENLVVNEEFIKNGQAVVEELSWGNEDHISGVNRHFSEFDMIICSELVYWEDLFDDLIFTLKKLSSDATQIYFAVKLRMKEIVDVFEKKMSDEFEIECIDQSIVDEIYPVKNMRLFISRRKAKPAISR